MGRETTEAISNVLSAYLTGQKEAENKRRWEAEFSLQQEKHQADMQSKMRDQQVYEQMQAEKALKDKYTKALMQSGGAAMPPQTAAEIEIYNAYLAGEEAKQRKQFAAEDQARENEKAAYDKTQRKAQEEADAIARKNAAEILRQNKTARTVLDGIPEELRDDYLAAAADYKVKQEQLQVLDGRVSDLRKQLNDAMLNNATAVPDLQAQLKVFEPLVNQLILETNDAANKTSQYHQFRDKFHGSGTRADFDSFLDELIAQPKATPKPSTTTTETPNEEPSGLWDRIGKKFSGGKVGFNLKKAIDMKALPDDPAVKRMVSEALIGKEVIEGPDGKAQIIDTGEAYPLADPTDPLGLGLFAGVAGAGKAVLKGGLKMAEKKAVRNLVDEWQPNFDAPDFGGGIADEVAQLGFEVRPALSDLRRVPGAVHGSGPTIPMRGTVPIDETEAMFIARLNEFLKRAPRRPDAGPLALPAPPYGMPTGSVPYDVQINPQSIEDLMRYFSNPGARY